MLLIAVVIY